MHIRKTTTLAILCFFLVAIGAFCQTNESSPLTAKALARLVKVRPGLKVDAKAIQALVEKILADKDALESSFEGKDFIGLAQRLGERGTSLLTHKYQKLWGKHSAAFWQNSWTAGAKLEVVPVGIMVTDVIGRQTVPRCLPDKEMFDKVNYDLAAVLVLEFHVKEAAPAAHNATSLGEWIYRHQDICVWE